MKGEFLLKHLRKHGCYLKREGKSHSLWSNPKTGQVEAIPRHTEVSEFACEENMPWVVGARIELKRRPPNKSFERTAPASRLVLPLAIGIDSCCENRL